MKKLIKTVAITGLVVTVVYVAGTAVLLMLAPELCEKAKYDEEEDDFDHYCRDENDCLL